jgi:hypothetical protein
MTDNLNLALYCRDRMQTDAVLSVITERNRQDEKWGVQNHGLLAWNAILGEERGEFEEALLEGAVFDNGRREEFPPGRIRKELVEVCAVALAMIECIDRNGVAP